MTPQTTQALLKKWTNYRNESPRMLTGTRYDELDEARDNALLDAFIADLSALSVPSSPDMKFGFKCNRCGESHQIVLPPLGVHQTPSIMGITSVGGDDHAETDTARVGSDCGGSEPMPSWGAGDGRGGRCGDGEGAREGVGDGSQAEGYEDGQPSDPYQFGVK